MIFRKTYGNNIIKVIGVYKVVEDNEVNLIELQIYEKTSNIDMSEFTQEIHGKNKDFWQVAYDEHYLNDTGEVVIGQFKKPPLIDYNPTRVAFFMYFINFKKPLISQFGCFYVPRPKKMPERLKKIIKYQLAE